MNFIKILSQRNRGLRAPVLFCVLKRRLNGWQKEHITVDKSGFITLTASGREIAEMIYERHRMISSWLIRLGVPEQIALADACKIEHVISRESFEALKEHIK